MSSQPLACLAKPRACRRDQSPVHRGVVEPLEVHELVNHHVVAHPVGHCNQSPVQADVSITAARTPSRPLISNADSRHPQAVLLGKRLQPCRQFLVRLRLEPLAIVGGKPHIPQHGALALNPLDMSACEGIGFPLRASARNRDAQAAVVLHAQQVAARATMADEVERGDGADRGRDAGHQGGRRCPFCRAERKPQLHLDRIPDSSGGGPHP